MCRRCGQRDETTAHVLSSCPTMFPEYTKRHDAIEAILISSLDKSNIKFTYKPHLGILFPDIVVDNPHVIIDVTCPLDNIDTLSEAYHMITKWQNTPPLDMFCH